LKIIITEQIYPGTGQISTTCISKNDEIYQQ